MNNAEKTIPVVFATNNNYAPYLAVALESVIAHKTEQYVYAVYVLYDKLEKRYLDLFEKQSFENVQIQCVNVSELIDANVFYEKAHFSREMYFRLLIAELFPQYEKVVYLDCDLILRSDIAELFQIDIGDNIIGAVNDFIDREMYSYCAVELKINPEDYFNSGMLVINTKLFNEHCIKQLCTNLLKSMPRLVYPDQDILNMSCNGKIYYFNSEWNFQWQHECNQKQFYNAREKIKIIHYASNIKPWKYPGQPLAIEWWNYARKTLVYEEILFYNLTNQKKTFLLINKMKKFIGRVNTASILFKEYGLKYAVERIIAHIKK